jgi:hypothetical protein
MQSRGANARGGIRQALHCSAIWRRAAAGAGHADWLAFCGTIVNIWFFETDTRMEFKDFRQPMVTSIGVILGFLMGFLGQWVTEPNFKLASASDDLVFAGSLLGVVMLLCALYRMLSPRLPKNLEGYYMLTLRLYMGGIVVAFVSMLVSAFI